MVLQPGKSFLLISVLLLAASVALSAEDPTPLPSVQWKETGAGLWRECALPFAPQVNAMDVVDGVLYVSTSDRGILIARDEGKSWSQVVLGGASFHSISLAGGVIYAGGKGGVACSLNGGKSWSTKAFLKDRIILSIAASAGRLFFGTDDGLYYSDDKISTVQKTPGSPPGSILDLFSGSSGLWVTSAEKDKDASLYSSNDDGKTWKVRTGLPAGKYGEDLRTIPYQISMDGSALCISSQNNLLYSTDGGVSWNVEALTAQAIGNHALGSGAFLVTDSHDTVQYVTPGAKAKPIADIFPGVKAEWYYDGFPVEDYIPEGGVVPRQDWTFEEVCALLTLNEMEDPELVSMPPSQEGTVTCVCSDGKIVYAATNAGRIFRYPLYVLLGNDPVIPDEEQALVKNIDAAFRKQDPAAYESAIAVLSRKNDWNPYVFFNRGYLCLTQNKFKEAVSDFNQLLVLQPGAADGYYYRGIAYQGLERPVAAIKDFSSAITLKSSQTAYALTRRGVCYISRLELTRARADLEAAVKAGVKEAQQYIDKYLGG